MRTTLFAGVAFAALALPAAANAQSTGSVEFEETEIVVTGTSARDVGGVELPRSPKSKVVIDSELIQRQRPGQTVNDIINLSPGVSFQNNDATGAAGGTFTIRGFDSTRISQTVDGIPLNDTGNYAIYSNQQQDPETLDSVNVNLGSTDTDSPTASAAGGTVNIRTRVPGEELGALFSGTIGTYAAEGSGAGERMFYRGFAMIDTGDFTGIGTRAFASASWIRGDNPFNNYGRLKKAQFNGRLYQEIGGNGDFISVAGHYNQNRNNFFGSGPLRNDTTQSSTNSAVRLPGTGSGNRFPAAAEERFYTVNYPCTTTAPVAGTRQTANGCGTEFDRRYNPSNTGNIRGSSRFTLMDGLVLTVDPSFQYVKANGGGTVNAEEAATSLTGTPPRATGITGVINTGPNSGNTSPSGFGTWVGRDLNGDGDLLDQVTITNPSQTQTRRYVVNTSLAYDINDFHRVRIGYTFDRGIHRQTGESGLVAINGEPFDVFPRNNPVLTASGAPVQKRDRRSIAMLNQAYGEYRGEFGDLTAVIGLTGKWFQRDLDQRCFTVAANGNVACTPQSAAYAASNPYTYIPAGTASVGGVTRPASCPLASACVIGFAPPQERTFKYDKLLPNIGLTYDIGALSIFGNFSQGISVPGTDTLYSSFFFPVGTPDALPTPETTDSFDAGVRYRSSNLTATLAGWYTLYKNRIATAYDPELDITITRNLGEVKKYGLDASVAYKPVPELLLYVFGSLMESEIQENLQLTATTFAPTKGKRESGQPTYTLGGRIQGTLGPVDIGVQAKRTGKRYVNDLNLPITTGGRDVYPAATPAYTLVDLDVRVNMADYGLEKTYLQFNVTNLFDELYVGGFGGSSSATSVPFVQFGVPRSISASLVVGF